MEDKFVSKLVIYSELIKVKVSLSEKKKLTALNFSISRVSVDTLANSNVSSGITECIPSAHLGQTWILASACFRTTVGIIGAILIALALWCSCFNHTFAIWC